MGDLGRAGAARTAVVVAGTALAVILLPGQAWAETVSDVFERVYRAVVVVRATERDVPETGDCEVQR